MALFKKVSSFQGVLIRGVPAVLFIEVSSFQGFLIRGVPAFIEVFSFQGVLIRGVPAVLFIEVSLFQGVLIREGSCCPVFQGVLISGGPNQTVPLCMSPQDLGNPNKVNSRYGAVSPQETEPLNQQTNSSLNNGVLVSKNFILHTTLCTGANVHHSSQGTPPEQATNSTASETKKPAPRKRLASLDTFRGLVGPR